MEKHQSRRRLRSHNRHKLMARWQDEQGQQIRAKLLARLKEHKTLPDELSEDKQALGADLRCINLSGENLDGVDLSEARLQGANLARASLKGASLVGADLRDTLLRRTDFTNADLRSACLNGAVIEKTIFENANLEGAGFSKKTIIVNTELPLSVNGSKSSPWFADSLSSQQIEKEAE